MPLYRVNELLDFLESIGTHPKKGLSQNFLIDGNIVAKILKEADIQPKDQVLEIGPGPGVLTEALLGAGASLVAIEKDHLFASELNRLGKLEVFCQDVRDFDFGSLKGKTKVVSNLPYHLTSPILSLLVPKKELFSTLTVMVQEEVARRMTGIPNTSNYSSFTIFLAFYAHVHYAFFVSRNCFFPKPKVDSAIVTLVLKEPPDVDENAFFFLVRSAFQQRRKMLKSSLGKRYGSQKIEEALVQIGKNRLSRPEALSLEEFLALFKILENV